MEKNEIRGYEPLVEELKQLIHKKQYHVLKVINAETINLYWEIGEEIYKQQQEKGWGKSIVLNIFRNTKAYSGRTNSKFFSNIAESHPIGFI